MGLWSDAWSVWKEADPQKHPPAFTTAESLPPSWFALVYISDPAIFLLDCIQNTLGRFWWNFSLNFISCPVVKTSQGNRVCYHPRRPYTMPQGLVSLRKTEDKCFSFSQKKIRLGRGKLPHTTRLEVRGCFVFFYEVGHSRRHKAGLR